MMKQQPHGVDILMVAAMLLAGGNVYAQEVSTTRPIEPVSLNRLNPGIRTSDGFGILRPLDMGPMGYSVNAIFDYGHQPLSTQTGEDSAKKPILTRSIQSELRAYVGGSIAFYDWSRFSLDLNIPVMLWMTSKGDITQAKTAKPDKLGLGDVELGVRARIWGDNDDVFSIGAYAGVRLPTSYWLNKNEHWTGYKNLKAKVNILAEVRPVDGLGLTLNVGGLFGKKDHFGNIRKDQDYHFGQQLTWGLGAHYYILSDKSLGFHGELFGTFLHLAAQPYGKKGESIKFGQKETVHGEGLLGIKYHTPFDLALGLGVAGNIFATKESGGHGIGTPRFRVLFNIGYEHHGKVDRDGDGVPDVDDKCPDQPGPADNNGCPLSDKDGDGVFDRDDRCPDEPGPESNQGCPLPDGDEDGVPDAEDECPTVPGPKENKGCPIDTDGDGVPDTEDKCPNEPGPKENLGCPPDFDGDGTPDAQDKCPKVPGPKENHGCPFDADGDGIPDSEDQCPNEFGTVANKGCPEKIRGVVVTKESITIDESIYFASGKATIQRRSYKILDSVVKVLQQYSMITKIRIEGHTDDVGKDESNLKLSKERAKAVLDYIVKKKVDAGRLESEGFGESKPVCTEIEDLLTNKRKNRKAIKECRDSNRRVEFRISEINGQPVEAAQEVEIEKVQKIDDMEAYQEEQAKKEAGKNKAPEK